ncbi:MAG: hypothetical protein ILA25_01540 [Prevotella sp.]|nr:hypothetical protein [Prevotella sp.]
MEKQLENRKVTEQDTVLLLGASECRKNIQECINNLGEVLNEFVVKESLDDPDTLGWMSRYVAETRMFLATLKSDLSLSDNRQQKPEN